MSLDEQNIQAFVKLIQSQPSLFSSDDRTELLELVSTLPNEVKPISNALVRWCKSRDAIRNEWLLLTGQISELAIAKAASEDVEPINLKDHKETLMNAIRVSDPAPAPQLASPQQPPQPQPPNSQP